MSSASQQQQKPTPERFFDAVNAHQQTEAIKSAIELELFTAIAEGHNTAEALATRCKVAERGARILCDFLAIHGFLTKAGAQYALAPDSAIFLNKLSPAYIGSAVEFLLAPRTHEGTVLIEAPAIDRFDVEAPVAADLEHRQQSALELTIDRRRVDSEVSGQILNGHYPVGVSFHF